ncbi:hypothetical protein MNBD_GAMMA23-1778 [hydrothermal vent metagenome]|uniref:DUF4870 domain-containing protein n=1 Tax=hydrothermal vent metagenome TaxID=652676 RepID=A0A3B1A4G6_9ZZZZ
MNKTEENQTITGRQASRAARWFSLGNIASMIIPFPLGIFWFGASMVVYAMHRHHPNPRVGYYTQQAAYQFYAVLGLVVVVATFFGTELLYWMVTWAISAAILIPLSVYNLMKINKEQWQDVIFKNEDAQ